MSARVVAFEGNLGDDVPLSWGTAAIEHKGQLLNPVTHRTSPLRRLRDLVDGGFLAELPTAIEIREEYVADVVIVLAFDTKVGANGRLFVDTGKCGGLVAHSRKGARQFYIFAGKTSFDQYCELVIADLINGILYAEQPNALQRDQLLRVALILNSAHPEANALKAYYSDDDFVRELCEAQFGEQPGGMARFRELLEALRSTSDQRYGLVYEGGAAEGGGFDVDVVRATFDNLTTLHENIEHYILGANSFLAANVPGPRLVRAEAASAKFFFAAEIEGRSLGEKVARYIELRTIARLLRGDVPDELRSNRALLNAIRGLVSPVPGTIAKQRPINSDHDELLTGGEGGDDTVAAVDHFALLGFQSGLRDGGQRLEILVFPARYIWVSVRDDGDGGVPLGTDFLVERHDFLFQPAVFELKRVRYSNKGEKYWLRSMVGIDVTHASTISVVPSSLVDGAYLLLESRVTVSQPSAQILAVGNMRFNAATPWLLPNLKLWMHEFAESWAEHELHLATEGKAQWFPPAIRPNASALQRVLLTLHRLKGRSSVTTLVREINKHYNVNVRVNNTRREVYSHPDLLEFDPKDRSVMQLTEEGRRRAAATARAMGDER